MNINNPTTFSAPDLTLSTSNSSGTAGALRADDTILVYDTTSPAAIGASAVVGSAATSARRDHVHAGVVAITSTDEAIARFNGTAGALQDYSSRAPTISDAGIISLTSGALKFPATAIASANVNTLDDYEEGTFTPTILDATLNAGESQSYTTQLGFYTKVGNRVMFSITLIVSSLGSLTTSDAGRIGGLPFTSQNTTSLFGTAHVGFGNDLNLTTAGRTPTCSMDANVSYLRTWLWDATTGINNFTLAQLSADGSLYISGQYQTAT